MSVLYYNDENYYIISSSGTYYNVVTEIGKTNTHIMSKDLMANFKELQFTKNNIYDIINRLIPLSYDDIRDIGNNQYILVFATDWIGVNSWLDIHNYLIKYS